MRGESAAQRFANLDYQVESQTSPCAEMHEMCIDAGNITCRCQNAAVLEIPKEALMSQGIKAVIANHMHGALAGLSAITVGADLLTVRTYRVDDVTARVQVNRRSPHGPLVFTIRLTEGVP